MSESQQYFSTRSSTQSLKFEDVVIQGLANDGGLYIPHGIPFVSEETLYKWKDLSFADLAYEVLSLYISENEIPEQDLRGLIKKSYSTFRSEDVTPIQTLSKDKQLYLLELFHGPTYAFKDVALQFVGNLFEYFLTRKNADKAEDAEDREKVTVIGATSGDTGSAAIYGLRNKKDVSVFILYPTGRVSPIQESQMTTVLDKNVHTISVKGTFDDCQDLVKQAFADKEFNDKYCVGAVNSINWSRILAQMTYYFYSYFQLIKKTGESKPKVKFVVPTGNFGDILAGFYAKRMGLPCELVIATNSNDILHRFFQSGGSYSKSADGGKSEPVVHASLSPAMDILVSSNFERFLWYAARDSVAKSAQESGSIVNKWMNELKTNGTFTVPQEAYEAARVYFSSERTTDEETTETIKNVYTNITPNYILDPHSAVAVSAALRRQEQDSTANYVALSTAHPAKFADAVDIALKNESGFDFDNDVLPQLFKDFATMEKKQLFAEEAKFDVIKDIIVKELSK